MRATPENPPSSDPFRPKGRTRVPPVDAVQQLVSIEVHDQGIGIAAETVKHIKDPFFTTKRDMGGTGLGLSISDKIVRDHGGFMEFLSPVDRGTTVKVYLPVKNKTIQQEKQPV